MNAGKVLLSLFIITAFLNIKAQRTTFLKFLSSYSDKTLLPTDDNGSIITSIQWHNINLIKLNAEGFSEWRKTINTKNYINKTIKLSNGNYLTGYTNNDDDICLMVYDSLGNSISDYTYGDDENIFYFHDIIITADSKLLILGAEGDQLYMQKTEFDGTVIWNKTYWYINISPNVNMQIIRLSDLSYLVSTGNSIIKFDIHGAYLWEKETPEINSIFPFFDGFCLTGKSGPISRYNLNAEIIWENTALVNQFANVLPNHNIISAGDTTLSEINRLGNIIWQKKIPKISGGIYKANDGGFFMYVKNSSLLRTDSIGNYSTLTLHYNPSYYNIFKPDKITVLKWDKYNISGTTINISYSTALEGSWTEIDSNFPADSLQYSWLVPEINSNSVYIKITDSNNPNVYDRNDSSLSVIVYQAYDKIAVNNVRMWFGNNGDGSHNPQTDNGGFFWPGGIDATISAVFEDGLFFGGKYNDEIRVNGSNYRHGFSPGIILENGMPDIPQRSEYKIYKSKKNWELLPEGKEKSRLKYDYNNWPADLGAPVIDRDNDGIYTPGVDDNVLGDEAFFYVNNSADVELSANVYGSPPVPLEFQTTIWGYNQERLEDVVFKKYKIINKGDVPITDMYLSYWTDDDLGFAGDDYVGVDTSLNLGYTYNGDEYDDWFYGSQPPAVGHMMVQGPKVQATMEDSAWFNSGWHKGYLNKGLNSFISFVKDPGYPNFGAPYQSEYAGTEQMYNYMRGFTIYGTPILAPNNNDTTHFMVAGDPVSGNGWYEGPGWPDGPTRGDKRYMESSGPFTLAAGDTQEVAYAILMARGSDRLNSITKLREKAAFIQNFYNGIIIKSVKERGEINPTKFVLNQNYPNPFNPSTTIKYFVPVFKSGDIPVIHLKIYDILGREIATLVNEKQSVSGSHKIIFNASKLASGVYIYRLTAVGKTVNFAEAKKMVLLR